MSPRRPNQSPDLSSPTARRRVKPRPFSKPHWQPISAGKFLGYRPSATGAGAWLARLFKGGGRYVEAAIGAADDKAPANGDDILSHGQALAAALAWCAHAGNPEPAPSSYTVARALADYLEWYRQHRKAAADAQARAERIIPILGDETERTLTPAKVRRWHQGLAATPEGAKPDVLRARKATANRSLVFLRAALNFAVAEERMSPAVAGLLKAVRPFRAVDKPRVRFFDAGETKRLLNGCEPEFRQIVLGALLTGARYGELTAMEVRDYSSGSHVTVSGKTDGRTIFLNAEAVAFFDQVAAGRRPEERMFLRSDGEPWLRSHQTRRMREAARSAKLSPPNNFQILRHTYASLYLMSGGSLEGLARQLGHADTRMTIRSYAHLAEKWRAKEAKAHAPGFGQERAVVAFREK